MNTDCIVRESRLDCKVHGGHYGIINELVVTFGDILGTIVPNLHLPVLQLELKLN